ncbi:DUF4260 family protein [Miltoncostaea marina]|uniref:DUF4260 family protein n=1 Tax=Miltoncostaea marina TaxID=2843215 RepID=UPI001C3D5AB1|nr:DUF4260 family protein [Miltoncostaea marina]
MHTTGSSSAARRLAWLALAAALGTAAGLVLAGHGGWWWLLAFGAGPDLALLAGAGGGMAQGRLHPRAVPLYNALHRPAVPAAMLAAVLVAGLGAGPAVGALAWGIHIAVDRAAGYGLRDRDGFQRG